MTTITQEEFVKLVDDFEYGIIDSYTIDNSIIEWQPADQTCFEFVDGEVYSTGSFKHLLEYFVEETA